MKTAVQPHFAAASLSALAWDPTPSAPDLFREELFSTLANECNERPTDDDFLAGLQTLSASFADDHAAELEVQESDAPGTSDRSPSCDSTNERRQESNRQAQKRWRSRQKGRAQAAEARLAATTAELQRLKAQQQKLQATNILLEKMSQLDRRNSNPPAAVDELLRAAFCYEVSATDQGPGIKLTVHGKQRSVTIKEMSMMSLDVFAAIWSELIRELGAILLQLGESFQLALRESLERLTIEASTLMGCMRQFNTALYKAALAGRLNEHHLPCEENLDSAWFDTLPSLLDLSDAQVDDALYIRRLYLTKRGLLAVERNALMAEMDTVNKAIPHATESLASVSNVASLLQQNAIKDYHVYIKVCAAMRRGVFSTQQWATMIVHSYPFFPSLESFLDSIGARHNEPSLQQILTAAPAFPMTQEMIALDEYVRFVCDSYRHDSVAVPRAATGTLSFVSQPASPAKPSASLRDMMLY
ncbi:hypothetical protein WJX77_003466 [Trebouxia sp. C0004]